MKKVVSMAGLATALLISVLLIRTALFTSEQVDVPPAVDVDLDGDQMARRLAGALRFLTISNQDRSRFDAKAFQAFHAYLEAVFPKVHTSLKKEVVNQYSLLYTWQGSEAGLWPALFMAHQDVVPVVPGTMDEWVYPPFEGAIAEGYIWGRGALDVKSGMMGMLEAVEALLLDGFQPKRTVYFAFGHDEEVGGSQGAEKIAKLLESRNIRLEYVLDEGGFVVQGLIPGVSGPVALVGVAEKGYVSLELSVRGKGGHSSVPPKHTAVGILSKAVVLLEKNPFPSNMTYAAGLFKYLSPELPFLQRLALANLWLFCPVVEQRMSRSPVMNAGIRTTTAATMFRGSVKDNILPTRAAAVVNFRIMPGESVDSVIDYVRKTIDDPQVQVQPLGYHGGPSPVSDIHSKGYEALQKTILQVGADKEMIVAPYLVVGATDSRYFTGLSDNVYRFLMNRMAPDDLKRIHGTNERISIENYLQVVRFYYQLLRNFD